MGTLTGGLFDHPGIIHPALSLCLCPILDYLGGGTGRTANVAAARATTLWLLFYYQWLKHAGFSAAFARSSIYLFILSKKKKKGLFIKCNNLQQ